MSRHSFGGFQRFSSARNASIPAASIFSHSAGGRRIDRNTMTSSGGFGGLPRGRLSCSMGRTVAPIYRATNNPCNLDLSCYINSMDTNQSPSKDDLLRLLKEARELAFNFARGSAYIRPGYVEKQNALAARIDAAIEAASGVPGPDGSKR